MPSLRLSERGLGIRGPAGRSFAGRLPASVLWGLGIGLYGLIIASSASTFAKALSEIPGIQRMIEQFYPGMDFTTSAAFLQLAFVGFGLLMLGLVAVVLVSGWTSDEREKRLDLVLAAPLRRRTWALRSGFGAQAALAVTVLIVALLLALGAAWMAPRRSPRSSAASSPGSTRPRSPAPGSASRAWCRRPRGSRSASVLAVGSYLLDFIGGALQLPAVVLDLALSRHLGRRCLASTTRSGSPSARCSRSVACSSPRGDWSGATSRGERAPPPGLRRSRTQRIREPATLVARKPR